MGYPAKHLLNKKKTFFFLLILREKYINIGGYLNSYVAVINAVA